VSLQPIRLLERLSRRRNACIGDKDHIALFDRRETSFHVKTQRQRLVTDIFTATVTASKDPLFVRVVLRPETLPYRKTMSNIENHQIRSTPSSQLPSYIARLYLVITYLGKLLINISPGTSPTPSRASTEVCPTYVDVLFTS
jgi:hypothetical protein